MERPSRTRWPVGLIGMLALVAVVETAISLQPLRFVETASLSWRLGVDAIPREAVNCEVACLGDSLVKIGLIPEVIREGSGRSTYNFAMAQAPAPATYFLLRRLIEAGGKPTAIVVDFKSNILAGGPKFSLRHWQTVATARETLELAIESRSPALLFEIALGRLLPSYRDRMEIRDSILSTLRGETATNFRTNQLAVRNWGLNRGAHVNSPRNIFSGEISDETHKKMLSDGWKCHRINARYIDRLFDLAASKQIPVYWLIPPLSPELQGRREQTGVDAAYAEFAQATQAKHPGVTVIDGRRSDYQTWTFADPTHLNGLGAVALSHDLASILASPQQENRWVALPRFREGTSSLVLEDIEQSRQAIEAEANRRIRPSSIRAN